MKIYLDTADTAQIRDTAKMGLLDGVTTNPTLISQTGKKFDDCIREICEICSGPVSAECVTETFEEMMPEARKLAKLAKNVVVKIPLTREGMKTVRACSEENIRTNVTLCFSGAQALLAAKAGASFADFANAIVDPGDERALRILARLCVKAGRLKKSVETYRKILERKPSDAGEIEQEIDRLEERMEEQSS